MDHLLDAIDRRSPGLITACLITGSIALGDHRPGRSDIDLVLVRASAADTATVLDALEPALVDLRRTFLRPVLDGLVVTDSDLAAGPDRMEGERPIIVDTGVRLGTDGSGRNPVTWQMLRQGGITWRGTPIDSDRLWHDPERLAAWTRENLRSYWRSWLAKSDRLASWGGAAALGAEATEWGVLGVTRLHATLTTGQITSKHGAGRYGLAIFPKRWHRILDEALRIREQRGEGQGYGTLFARRRAMRNYVAMVIDAALALPPEQGGPL